MTAPVVTIVGCAPAWGNPGEPCSSYLVEAGGARILLDCGPGAFAALRALDDRPLDAVVLSHLHFDHVGDLIPFGYCRRYSVLQEWPAPRLLAPPGGIARLAALAVGGGGDAGHLDGPFRLEEYVPGEPAQIGDATLSFAALEHPGVSHAIRIEAGGRALVYSGDTGSTPALAAHATGADLLLCEATYSGEGGVSDHVHLTAADAGQAAPMRASAGCCSCTSTPRCASARWPPRARPTAGRSRPRCRGCAPLPERQRLAGAGGRDRADDLGARGVLREVAVDAGGERGADELGLGVGREHHDARRRALVAQRARDLAARDLGHALVEQGDLGLEPAHELERRLAVARLRDDLVARVLERAHHAAAVGRMVIGDEHPRHAATSPVAGAGPCAAATVRAASRRRQPP